MPALHFNNIIRGFGSHNYVWWVDGSEGSVGCHHDRVFVALKSEPSTLHEIKLKGAWFPDGFAGSMEAFISAVAQGKEAPVGPGDNLNTVALTSAMVKSSHEGRMVTRQEIWDEFKGGR
jgi:predicted dehydrogenase